MPRASTVQPILRAGGKPKPAYAGDCMFNHLEIRNFKSVEHLELGCRRVNVLIGEPNTGKSNILEALGLISYVGHSSNPNSLRGFVRCEDTSSLFYDGDLNRELEIILNIAHTSDSYQDFPTYQILSALAYNWDSQTDDLRAALLERGSPDSGNGYRAEVPTRRLWSILNIGRPPVLECKTEP